MYKIEEVVFIKIHANHVPYYLGMIVSGPKGGKYYLDEYCTEILLASRFNWTTQPNRTSILMAEIGSALNNIKTYKGEDIFYAKLKSMGNITKLIRIHGKMKAKELGKKINIQEVTY